MAQKTLFPFKRGLIPAIVSIQKLYHPLEFMGELSKAQVLLAPLALTGLIALAGLSAAFAAGLDTSLVAIEYFEVAVGFTCLALLVWAFIETTKMALRSADRPLQELRRQLPERLDHLVLPAVIFPLFLTGFTVAKSAIPFLIGYRWDAFWANADHWLFGTDPWRITHWFIGPTGTRILAWCYTFVWGTALVYVNAFVAIYGTRKTIAEYFAVVLLTWFVVGFLGAYAWSSAGPVFLHLVDSSYAHRFEELRSTINQSLPPGRGLRFIQSYLELAFDSKVVVRGGGISAMPSVHVATATIFFLVANGAIRKALAAVFYACIFVGSVHFGYHYALDGLIGSIIAVGCWFTVRLYIKRLSRAPLEELNPVPIPSGAE
ncbi:phosphatase PAP2 family protein [Sphingomonas sp. RB56-2]|uniref:Phosphatase PAP2 family protein n=1 Tax=Sphingomonas brevis TaxID=2908206 RepID=A0ABT0SBC9_9SPHN|nr:phosphatase PAP2 family protein [Sphingomonas brevis]MCL6741419.1 phosphatase PAP2 family protein [Sphingomonas brevis]